MNKKLATILIIDDNPSNIDFLLGLLAEYEITVAVDGERGLEQISQEKPDLILLDVNMPGIDGYVVCSIIKSNPKTRDIPILFLSANTDSESIIKGFEVGGVDYITKPYQPKEVLARVETHLKLKYTVQRLEKFANEDPMTGISNRRHFFAQANNLFLQKRAKTHHIQIFTIDIDNLKVMNDTFGHDIGDEVIKVFVETVKKELSVDHSFARFGGDEFVIMMLNQQNALDIIKKIQNHFNKPFTLLGQTIDFSISVGMAEEKESDENIDAIIKRADMNLYKKKRTKRAHFRV